MTRDVSAGGISFVDTKEIAEQFIAVEIPVSDASPVQMVVEILRCRPVDRFYDIGGKFVTRLQ